MSGIIINPLIPGSIPTSSCPGKTLNPKLLRMARLASSIVARNRIVILLLLHHSTMVVFTASFKFFLVRVKGLVMDCAVWCLTGRALRQIVLFK